MLNSIFPIINYINYVICNVFLHKYRWRYRLLFSYKFSFYLFFHIYQWKQMSWERASFSILFFGSLLSFLEQHCVPTFLYLVLFLIKLNNFTVFKNYLNSAITNICRYSYLRFNYTCFTNHILIFTIQILLVFKFIFSPMFNF